MKSTSVAPIIPIAQPSKNGKSTSGRFAAGNRGRPTDTAQGRTRAYLTPTEVEALMKAARQIGRHGHRDATLILMAYRHGLRVSELIALRWDQIDLTQGLLAVVRRKHGVSSTHPLGGTELRALRRLHRESGPARYIFLTERGAPLSADTVRKLVRRAGELAKIPFPVHPHQLRHAAGYKLANQGTDTRTLQHYLGHRNIQHTVRYTELAHGRFNGLWKD